MGRRLPDRMPLDVGCSRGSSEVAGLDPQATDRSRCRAPADCAWRGITHIEVAEWPAVVTTDHAPAWYRFDKWQLFPSAVACRLAHGRRYSCALQSAVPGRRGTGSGCVAVVYAVRGIHRGAHEAARRRASGVPVRHCATAAPTHCSSGASSVLVGVAGRRGYLSGVPDSSTSGTG